MTKWNSELFSEDVDGIDAMTFFLSLAVIKSFANIFVHQEFANKRALPYNSLLFGYVMRKELAEIWGKVEMIELNIEAYFGEQMVSLFARLFKGDVFVRILMILLEERQKDPQGLFVYGLVSVFLALVELTDCHSCAYLTAEHFIITMEELA